MPRRNVRYYVDWALVPVVLVSLFLLLTSIWNWPPATWNAREAVLGGVILGVSLVIARERRVVFAAVLAYIACQSVFGISISPDVKHTVAFIAIGSLAAIALIGMWFLSRHHKFSYDAPNTRTDSMIFATVFGGIAVGLFIILRDTARFYIK